VSTNNLSKLPVPLPNMNGNSAESLIEQLRGILDAIRPLEKAIRHASDCWHGRNFQPLPPEQAKLVQARAQDGWFERQKWLDAFEQEILEMAIKLQQQHRR
jgi:hypothetical protein